MSRQVIEVPEFAVFAAKSTAPVLLVVKGGGLIFLSGIPPIDPETGAFALMDVAAQTRRAMDNIGLCLRAAGADFGDVMRTTVYVTNAAYFAVINTVYAAYFQGPPPARTFVVVGSWPAPFDVEIECTALDPAPP